MRERKWQSREILTWGVYGGYTVYTPAHKWKRKTELQETFKSLHSSFNAVLTWRMDVFFLPSWIQISLLLTALNKLRNNKPG